MLPARVPTLCLLMGTSVGNSHMSGWGEAQEKEQIPLWFFHWGFHIPDQKKKKKFENQIHFSLKESIGETDTTEILIPVCCLPAP